MRRAERTLFAFAGIIVGINAATLFAFAAGRTFEAWIGFAALGMGGGAGVGMIVAWWRERTPGP